MLSIYVETWSYMGVKLTLANIYRFFNKLPLAITLFSFSSWRKKSIATKSYIWSLLLEAIWLEQNDKSILQKEPLIRHLVQKQNYKMI